MTAVIAWLTFLAVASTPAYEPPGYYESIVDQGFGVVGYPGQLRIVDSQLAERFLPIAYCESGYNQRALGKLGERGLMQIMGIWIPLIESMGLTWDSMFEGVANIDVAIAIYGQQGLGAWSCAR